MTPAVMAPVCLGAPPIEVEADAAEADEADCELLDCMPPLVVVEPSPAAAEFDVEASLLVEVCVEDCVEFISVPVLLTAEAAAKLG